MHTIDFETDAITPRPHYPPRPVGVSIKKFGEKARYYAFDHPTNNNCTKKEAIAALYEAWSDPEGILCHNAKFDYEVALVHMGMWKLHWSKIHDTMMLVFLDNPHADSHGLKQSAHRLLGMPPVEQDAVRQWLVDAEIITKASKGWGAFISRAPGDLVGSYADGDVIRTEKLFKKLMPTFRKRKMLTAYDRERELMPILLEMERQGVPVDLPKLEWDCAVYTAELGALTMWCKRRLKVKNLNLDSGPQLVDALIDAGKVNTSLLGKTPTGAWKTDKAALAASITDDTLRAALAHRASLQTCLGTFMQPWLTTARGSGGLIYTQWNQLKQYGGGGSVGAVTGRMSSSPNFQNIPKQFAPMWKHQDKSLPKCPLTLSDLPLVRSYIVPPKGCTLIGRDYSQQELRILAHFEDGLLRESYLATPWMDIHATVQTVINERLGTNFSRGLVKTINFGLVYGMGAGLMAIKAGCAEHEAKAAKAAILSSYPELRDMQRELQSLAKLDEPIRTWGGRLYHCEPSKMINGKLRDFGYKMLNVLVQGSAADCTKQAMINYWNQKPKGHLLLLQVHDELLCAVPTAEVERGMDLLQDGMEVVEFSVPMLSEGKTSTTNWSEMRDYDKKGELV